MNEQTPIPNSLCSGWQGPSERRPLRSDKSLRAPTPSANDYKGSSRGGQRRGQLTDPDMGVIEPGGQLNPDWVELLMGWPKGWTSLEPLPKEEFYAFIEGFAGQDVRRLWKEIQSQQNSEQEVSGCSLFSSANALQPDMREHATRDNKVGIPLAGEATQEADLRSVRGNKEAARSSLRPGLQEQRSGEPSNAVPMVPRLLARYSKEARENGSWEDGVPRTARNIKNRTNRLKAIGNGQVPATVVLAWQTLSNL